MAESYDVIVVGAGPGGATAAYHMGQAGLNVLLVDRAEFPRDKVCGDAISKKATAMLPELGISAPLAIEDCRPSYGVRLCGGRGEALSLSFTDDFERGIPPSYVCTRRSFDNLLLGQAKRAGVTFWPQARVDELVREGEAIRGVKLTLMQAPTGHDETLRYPRSESVEAPLVVGADGAYSVVARELRMPQLNERHYCAGVRGYFRNVGFEDPLNHLEVHFLEHLMPGYFWIFSLPDGTANVGVGMLSKTIKERGIQLKDVLMECLRYPHLRDRFANAELVGVTKGWGLPLGSQPRQMAGDGWMLVGDAASLIDPFAGEGIGNAMLSGRHAARTAVQAVEQRQFGASALREYPRAVMGDLTGEFRLSYAMQRVGNWKWLLNAVIRKGSRSQELAHMMTGMFDDESQRRKLLSPLFYLRVLTA